MLFARETSISLKEFRAHLLSAKKNIEARMQALSHSMIGFIGTSTYEFGSSSHNTSNNFTSSPTVGHITAQPPSSSMASFSGSKFPSLSQPYNSPGSQSQATFVSPNNDQSPSYYSKG